MENNAFINLILENMNDIVPNETLREMKIRLNVLMKDYTVTQTQYSVATRETNPNAFRHFLVTKKIEGLSDNTLGSYKRTLTDFFNTVTIPLEQINAQVILTYLFNYQNTVHGTATTTPTEHTIEQIRKILSSFFAWSTANGYISKNPCDGINSIKYRKKDIDVLSVEQMNALYEATKTLKTVVEQRRALAILKTLSATGIRVSELINIKLSDIGWNTPVSGLIPVKIVSGKGNKDRNVFLTDEAGLAILDYIQIRNSDSEYLFVRTTDGNGQITVRTAQNIVSTLGKMVGVESCHPHMFRHTTGTEMASRGISINLVQKMLGHSDSSTTTKYYVKSEEKQLAEAIQSNLN